MTRSFILQAKNIHAAFKDQTLIKALSWSLQSGQIYSLTGASGAGKTTLSRILAGLEPPKSGVVTLNQRSIQEYRNAKQLWPVQYLYQNPLQAMNPRWTIQQIIMESGAFDAAHADRLGVEKIWMQRYPHELSGGQLQRISILRALGAQPRFLIADEITAALDPIAQMQIWKLLLHLAKSHNMGIIAISHDQELLQRLTPPENFLHLETICHGIN